MSSFSHHHHTPPSSIGPLSVSPTHTGASHGPPWVFVFMFFKYIFEYSINNRILSNSIQIFSNENIIDEKPFSSTNKINVFSFEKRYFNSFISYWQFDGFTAMFNAIEFSAISATEPRFDITIAIPVSHVCAQWPINTGSKCIGFIIGRSSSCCLRFTRSCQWAKFEQHIQYVKTLTKQPIANDIGRWSLFIQLKFIGAIWIAKFIKWNRLVSV